LGTRQSPSIRQLAIGNWHSPRPSFHPPSSILYPLSSSCRRGPPMTPRLSNPLPLLLLPPLAAPQALAIERELTFTGAGGAPLSGTLVLPPDAAPGRPVPAVVLVAGSGATGRNGNP